VRGRQSIKRAPVPLATLEMCKTGSSQLRLSGERIMKLAEELYQAGFISYPRTETDVYDPGMDLRVRWLQELMVHAGRTLLAGYCLLCESLFRLQH